MKKQSIILMMAMAASMQAFAQETYQDVTITNTDLNGTARYIGMGGAMEALGADISTISTNPAGIGLFRKSQVTASLGVKSQTDQTTNPSFQGISTQLGGKTTHFSFDQIGFVWSQRSSRNGYLNFSFNYHKSKDFNQILTAANILNGASQSKLTSAKQKHGVGDLAWNAVDANYGWIGNNERSPLWYTDQEGYNQLDYVEANAFLFGQTQKGYIGTYEFNISGNIKDKWFLGVTFGLHDVNYRSNKYYTENLVDKGKAESWEDLRIDGTGFDVKAGAIVRPFDNSNFRIGAYINSPIFYDLTQRNAADLEMSGTYHISNGHEANYDFKFNTPWKFGLSLGETVGKNLAMGLTYEYAKYSAIDNRTNDGGYYDYYGDYVSTSSSDEIMNKDTKHNLKGVHTLKLGLEYKPIDMLSLRIGYNYISPAFKENAFRDGSIESSGVAYASSTDYTNWKSTNRFTAGIGYQHKAWTLDFAAQYAQTKGTFYPFMSYTEDSKPEGNIIVPATNVTNNRVQLIATVGYRF